ncbi:hypothetical protein DBV05_g9710 [Lasiodiplodia theobromae]|uniref:Rhodopsin domain-containing protein n=1 Tax=Lasiodiplodia theobromae TaxID=45133 RepID=A0A5N5D1W2_9PEZI|nr:hypothetical protein DBV05_g9710 [Lasiodiplodia theobromae]
MSSLPSVDDYHLNDSQRNLRASLIICLTVSAVFVLLRALVRLHIQRQFALDDYLLLLALCGFSMMTAFMVHAIDTGGFGRLTKELPLPVLLRGIKFLICTQVSYTLTLLTTNLSIAFLHLRITGRAHPLFNRLHYVSIAVNVIIGLYECFALLFQCYPVYKAWTPTMQEGHCVDKHGLTIGIYVYSCVNVVLFCYYAFAPAPLIWKLQLKPAVKLSAIFVLGIGILASIGTIIRFRYLFGFSKTTDELKFFAPFARWCWIELCLAISAASVCAFRPLLRLIPCCAIDAADRKGTKPGSDSKKRIPRGYTFQLSEIDSMSIKEQRIPITQEFELSTVSTSAVATPATLYDNGCVSYFPMEPEPIANVKREWRLPDLERGS